MNNRCIRCLKTTNQCTCPSPAQTRSLPHKEVPSFLEVLETTYLGSFNIFWWIAVVAASICPVAELMEGLPKIPWLVNFSVIDNGFHIILGLALGIIGAISLAYLASISNLFPSEPVGCYVKHSLELVVLLAAVTLRWFWGDELLNFLAFSGFIIEFHICCQLRCHSTDLRCSDWLIEEMMQVVVCLCGNNRYAIFATGFVCLMVIWIRFSLYEYPKALTLPKDGIRKGMLIFLSFFFFFFFGIIFRRTPCEC